MTTPADVTWVLEAGVFPTSHASMLDAVGGAGCDVVLWDDAWLAGGTPPRLDGRAVVFHGSLGNAATITERRAWRPGAFCDVAAFRCSTWYPRAAPWLVHRRWTESTVDELSMSPDAVFARVDATDAVFVRPDSPLKPFSGRVLRRDRVSLAALDHGFYYDDLHLPVIVASVRDVGREWRYVVVEGSVVAGSAVRRGRAQRTAGRSVGSALGVRSAGGCAHRAAGAGVRPRRLRLRRRARAARTQPVLGRGPLRLRSARGGRGGLRVGKSTGVNVDSPRGEVLFRNARTRTSR